MLQKRNMGCLAGKFCVLSAGCEVDEKAVERWNLDLATLKKLGEAYRMGWLHNVLSRITPLTMRRRQDYLIMADVFIEDAQSANHVLDRFDSDLELFCTCAGIDVTEHMTSENVSEELRAHVELYNEVCDIFTKKFEMEKRDPICNLTMSPIVCESSNPFVKDFVDTHFNRK